MREKVALREIAAKVLPPAIAERGKQPYRAPEITPFFAPDAPEWVEEALSASALRETEIWDAPRVAGLLRRCRAGRATGMRESMALSVFSRPSSGIGSSWAGNGGTIRPRSGSRT